MMRFWRSCIAVAMLLTVFPALYGCGNSAGASEKSGYASVEELKTKRIGVLLGSTHDRYVTKNFPDAAVLQYKSPPDMVMAVKSGKVDAAMYSSAELVELMRQNSDLGIIGEPLYSSKLAMGFRKGDEALRLSFNSFLLEIHRDGTYDDMEGRWIEGGNRQMPVIPESPSRRRPLVVGVVSDIGLPFTCVRENRLVGFNIEMLGRFAASINRKITYVDLEFGSLIAALESGKIDMIGSVMSITPERSKYVDFSESYYEERAKFFGLKKNIAGEGVHRAERSAGDFFSSFFTGIAESFRSNIIEEGRWKLILSGLGVTVAISFFATLLGTVFGGIVCFLRMSSNRVLRAVAKAYISVMRGTPVLVVLMLIFYVVFASVNIDPLVVAVIAFGMNFAAYVSEIYRSGIESIDRGQAEAGIAMGFSRFEIFRYIILPQTVVRILPVYKGEFISLVKMTSIVGYIAVQDLTKASDIIRSRTFDAFFPIIMVAVLYYLISWSLLLLIGYLEKTINPRIRRRTLPQQA